MDIDEEVHVVRIPMNPEDVSALERMLSAADPFAATTIDTPGPYKLVDYVRNAVVGQYEVRAMLDRNLVARAIGLSNGQRVDDRRHGSKEFRLAAPSLTINVESVLNGWRN